MRGRRVPPRHSNAEFKPRCFTALVSLSFSKRRKALGARSVLPRFQSRRRLRFFGFPKSTREGEVSKMEERRRAARGRPAAYEKQDPQKQR